MKTKLEQLTMAEFVDLVSGNGNVLLGRHEIANPENIAIATRNIIAEYRSIADPAGNDSYLRYIDSYINARLGLAIYSICGVLIEMRRFEDAKKVLASAGISAGGWTDSRIESEVHVRMQKAKRAIDEIEKEDVAAESAIADMRKCFYAMIANMSAHFKFQIDIYSMMAPVFACLVARYHSEIKAMKKALKRSY